jgi:hypothetical protein
MLCGFEPLCECGHAIVRSAGSGSTFALSEVLASSKGTDMPGRQVPWQHGGKELQCVRADSGWGIVGRHGDPLWCHTCPSRQRSCAHVLMLLEGSSAGSNSNAGPNSTWLQPAVFEERFEEDFDTETGERRLTCLSRLQLPARPQDDPELHQLLAGGCAGGLRRCSRSVTGAAGKAA